MERHRAEGAGVVVSTQARRLAVAAAVGGGVLALTSGLLLGAAFGFDVVDVAPDLTALPRSRAGLLRWGALTDMLGFYLLSIPVILHLAQRYDAGRDPAMAVATAAGLAYAVIGSIGAVIVATVAPPLLGETTPQATAALDLVRQVVFVGLWQTLETIPWGVWMLVVGIRLRRSSPWLGGVALAIAAAALTAAAARLLAIEPLVGVPVALAIGLYPIWLLGLGMRLARTGTVRRP